ncbi:sulfate permease-like transporter, MFS superfamily [Frankia casuarinae]|uniref:Sulphate transporter n=2 Tax=Frankia casuarinae (strain DSM 45818 / CECT 9043 / HFP020203 / CcI3) TaxID=106370 RepID=Q2J5W7_FRACC|nr:sulphate transporter [Frankia casuarinae]ETA03802.1 sulfate permease-like transporter, MFS superfamily [Frankia sp. CcI6]KDA44491.1 sulfate permease-like transporter, MFS superfamily [Frankia sp. BMG5.23]OFB44400.1 sodium-independent anion transporter [Frankia sp. CgIM4]OHV57396.1 sodium-independent anion transporter [Frankia sp. CgIS1]ORT55356.1 sodium-independent anion transporter [Frankia sp. KB5]TFE33146.1 SulP family inorganic anion transporter [Frankia sp. B2]
MPDVTAREAADAGGSVRRTAPSGPWYSRRRTGRWPGVRHIRVELLAGLVTALALIPETISFSVVAGVDPKVGLFASFTISVVIAFTGGRPAMISAAAGSMALVAAPLVRDHGLNYLLATTIGVGLLMFVLGRLGVARLMRFVPQSAMIGFVNALAILIFTAQMPHVIGKSWQVYALVAAGLAILLALPRLTRAVPPPLVAVAVLTLVTAGFDISVPTVGDEGRLPSSLPVPGVPDVPLTWETLRIIAPYVVALTAVGLVETLLTAQIVDRLTDTTHDPNRESWGLGVANIVNGFFGGMGGCAMIGQTMVNVNSGGRGRLSTFAAGGFLLMLVVPLRDLVRVIPMSALVAVMILVSVMTFEWRSIQPSTLRRMPRGETAVMVATVAVVVPTHNLAYGVGVGVMLAALLFTRRAANLALVTSVLDPEGRERIYVVQGTLFFASTSDLVNAFDYACDPERVVIDLSEAHLLDSAAVTALDDVRAKYRERGTQVNLVGVNARSAALLHKLSAEPAQVEPAPTEPAPTRVR